MEFIGAGFGRKFGDMSRKLIWPRSHKGTMEDRATASAHYQQHIEDAKAAVPADRLLVFSADHGREPLCRFLGVGVTFPTSTAGPPPKRPCRRCPRGADFIVGSTSIVAAGLMYTGVGSFSRRFDAGCQWRRQICAPDIGLTGTGLVFRRAPPECGQAVYAGDS